MMRRRDHIHRILAGVSWHSALTIMRQVLAFGAMLVVVRVFSQDQYGHYQFVFTVVGLAGATSLAGMKTVVTQSVARGFDGTYRSATQLSFFGSVIGAVFILIYAGYVWARQDAGIGLALVLVALLFPFARGLLTWQSFLIGKQQFQRSALIQMTTALGGTIFLIVVVLLFPDQIAPASVALLSAQAVQNVLMHRQALKSIPPDAQREENALGYGIRVSLYDLFNVLGNVTDRFLIYATLSPDLLATYAVSTRLPELIKDTIQAVVKVFVPEFSKREMLSRSLDRKLNQFVAVLVVLVIGLAVFVTPWLIPLAFSDLYADAVPYCQLLLLSVAIGAYATVKSSFIESKLNETAVRGVQIFSNLIRIGTAAVLVPLWGIMGAVVSTLLYRLALTASVHFYIRKYQNG